MAKLDAVHGVNGPTGPKKGAEIMQKLSALTQGLAHTMNQLEMAVDASKLEDLVDAHSQASSGDACEIQDLKPARSPPGNNRLVELKGEAESGQEMCEQKTKDAKDALAALACETRNIDPETLVLMMESHLSSQLAKLKQAKDLCVEVAGDPDQDMKDEAEILLAEGLSGSLSQVERTEKYDKVTSRRIKEYFETCNQVAHDLITPNGLPMKLNNIFSVLDECDAMTHLGKRANEGNQEIVSVMDGLIQHLEHIQEQRKTCKRRWTNAQENEETKLLKVEKGLQQLKEDLREYLDALVKNEALGMALVNLQIQEQRVTDEIEQATAVSSEAAAAMTACSKKAVELRDEIAEVTEETASKLKILALKPATLALEGTEVALNILTRAEDQKMKQHLATEQELAESLHILKEKTDAYYRGLGNRSEIAQMKSKVQEKTVALAQQKVEVDEVQESKKKAVNQYASFAWLETVGYSFDKTAISSRSQEKVKENAGDFEMFPPVQKELPPSNMNASAGQCHALQKIRFDLIEKLIQEKLEEKLAIQEDYHRIEKEILEQTNQDLHHEQQELQEQIQALLVKAEEFSDVRSDASWEKLDMPEREGSDGLSLPALEDRPRPRQPPPPPPPEPPARRPSSQFQLVAPGVSMRSTVSTATVTFHARVKGMQSNERLFLVGGGDELGEWKAAHGREMESSDGRKWSTRLQLKVNKRVEYKYIRISEEHGQSFVQWEEGPNSKNRDFFYSGGNSVKDDGEICHFCPKELLEPPLAKQTFYEETQEATADRSSGPKRESVTVNVYQEDSWWGRKEKVARHEWASEMFVHLNCAIKSLCDKVDNKLEENLSALSRHQVEADRQINLLKNWLAKQGTMIESIVEKMENASETHKTTQEENVTEADNSVKLRHLVEEYLRDCTLAQKHRALEQDMASLQKKVQMNASLLSDSDTKLLKLESVVASHKNDTATSLKGMQREISKLDLKIPELDSRPSNDSTAQKDFQHTQVQLKELERQIASLKEELQRVPQNKMSFEAPAAPAKTDLPSPVADPSHVQEAKSPSPLAQPPFSPDEAFSAWQEVGWKPADSGSGNDVAPRRRSASMPKYTVPKARPAFTGLSRPKKPENEELRQLCLHVEQDLYEARKRNDPVDLRKKLLKEVLLRLHPDKFDKTGQSSEAMNWFESWRNTHVKWYYEPHDVPEADRKYLSKPSSGKDL